MGHPERVAHSSQAYLWSSCPTFSHRKTWQCGPETCNESLYHGQQTQFLCRGTQCPTPGHVAVVGRGAAAPVHGSITAAASAVATQL